MIQEYDVTIGIPIFNVEKYIEKSLFSALNQDFNGRIELLIVNDMTKDNSMDIINRIKVHHPNGENIHIINHQINQGLSAARNTIIDNFKGKYLYFMDSDDFISTDCIKKLYTEAENIQADVVYGALTTVDEHGDSIDIGQNYLKQEYRVFCQKDEFASYVFRDMHQYLRDYVTNTLFRDTFIKNNNLKFKLVRFYEDVLFSADFVPLISKGIIIPDTTYYYVIRNNSISNYQGREKIDLNEIKTFIDIFTYVKNKNIELKEKPYYEARCARSMVQMLFIISGFLKNKKIIYPPITNKMIKDAMKHPASISEIFRFKKHRFVNMGFYLIGIMPNWAATATVTYIAKLKRLL